MAIKRYKKLQKWRKQQKNGRNGKKTAKRRKAFPPITFSRFFAKSVRTPYKTRFFCQGVPYFPSMDTTYTMTAHKGGGKSGSRSSNSSW
jgi:hypothetical protein